jgi:hypothetical protein
MEDSGKNQKIANIFDTKNNSVNTGANPFGSTPTNTNFTQDFSVPKNTKRLNGYDSTILNKANFDNAENDDLSIDYRIKEKEAILIINSGIIGIPDIKLLNVNSK